MMKNLTELLTTFIGPRREPDSTTPLTTCNRCQQSLAGAESYQRFRVCPNCGRHFAISARERITMLVDAASFRETNRFLASVDPLSFSDRTGPYADKVSEAQRKTGLADAVVTGVARIGGQRVVVGALDFDFMGGSMGSVVGEKVALGFELATRRRLPIVMVATSGGARMQEGMLSLVQMAKTAAAVQRHHQSGLPYIAILAHPTTGGVFASFGSLSDIAIAEPEALIGFAGPRVVEQTIGKPLPPGSHTAEFQLDRGLIDMVLPRSQHREVLATLLVLFGRPRMEPTQITVVPEAPNVKVGAWETVQLARHPQRPTTLDYVHRILGTFVEIRGDRTFADDPAVIAGLGDLDGQTIVVVGQERGHDAESHHQGRSYPEGYRKAQRAMQLAAKFRLPLLTLVDTPGAWPGYESEERGLARTIAQSLALMSDLPVPIVSAIIGEGGSGGALALGVADRILMLENAVYSVIAPEGAASILYRDASLAEELAPSLKLTADDCLNLGVIDSIVAEPAGGAHADLERAAGLLRTAVIHAFGELHGLSPRKLTRARYEKFRRMGEYGTYYTLALQREVAHLQETLGRRLSGLRARLPRRRREAVVAP
ncbi:MAG TPA: acetyl-CoA carboxylase carboxyltransferase subunit alpha/beta [Dehalococcoidia bacterium]|nr:acetyl-CoA carboxylase carboxyltransferase subunit alpha/beta [Dehalococcoidia bacterium]